MTSSVIGEEFDLDITFKVGGGVTYKALAGYFFAGEGAALLINGNTDVLENAWEVKQMLIYKF